MPKLFIKQKNKSKRVGQVGAVQVVCKESQRSFDESFHCKQALLTAPINRQATQAFRTAQGTQAYRAVQAAKANEIVTARKILAIETSGSTFSLALTEGDRLVLEVFWYSGLTHSERLIPALDRLLSDAGWKLDDLTGIAVSTGPGSFTGIRVGLSCARTLAQTLSLPLTGMSTLDLLAASIPVGPYRVVPIVDALREEVFTIDEHNEALITSIPGLKDMFKKQKGMFMFVGNAVPKYKEQIIKLFGKRALFSHSYLNSPRAGVLALTAQKLPAHPYTRIQPLYIRRSWAEEKQQNP